MKQNVKTESISKRCKAKIPPLWCALGVALFVATPSHAMAFSLVKNPPVVLLKPADHSSTYMIHPHFRWVEDCGYSAPFYSQNHGAIEFSISAYGATCTQTVSRNIEISGNEIYDWDGMGISVENAQNVEITSNIVTHLNSTNFYPGGANYAVFLEYTDAVSIVGNDLRDTRPMDAPIQVENSTNTIILNNQTP